MIPLTSVIPLVLILMTITGAVYPAIDLTAGERERGTLEVLVSAPVTKLTLLLAKYIAVFVVAVLTAAVNLAMMLATITFSELSTMMVGPSGVQLLVDTSDHVADVLFRRFLLWRCCWRSPVSPAALKKHKRI